MLHGFEKTGYTGTIRIAAERVDADLLVRVVDDGQGMTDEKLEDLRRWMAGDKPGVEASDASDASDASGSSAFGIGLNNVHRRIRLNFPGSSGLSISRAASGGTTVEIRIPTATPEDKQTNP
ncbi:sensor histidine kinase [Cohnella rhizosphaerae]|uniref:ATP-binding protein n=1 Tax=Cohnella rhizosphaerae TaxID=1457232 RepID=A0A9X4QWX5_9BACL|nr:ATP-binding protein [Cohnella rhizosphaerae]MDG0814003.1 ATP-binding protein [Cohnella rhizosphaerae]